MSERSLNHSRVVEPKDFSQIGRSSAVYDAPNERYRPRGHVVPKAHYQHNATA